MKIAVKLIGILCVLIFIGCSEDTTKPDPEPEPEITRCVIPDYDYLKRQYFYFETPGDDFLNPTPGFGTIFPIIGGPENDEVEVFISLRPEEYGQTGGAEFVMRAYPVPGNMEIDESENIFRGRFRKLDIGMWEDFALIQDYNSHPETRYIGIRLFEPLDDIRALAVRYKSEDINSGTTYVVGDYREFPPSQFDTLLAELICPPYEDFGPDSIVSPYPSTWRMMMRNVYSLDSCVCLPGDSCDIRIEDTSGRTDRCIHAESGLTYIRLFGLDRYSIEGILMKDDLVDNIREIINLEHGYLIFPWPEAFDPPYQVMLDAKYIDPDFYYEESLFDYETLRKNSVIYNEILTPSGYEEYHFYNIVIEIVQ